MIRQALSLKKFALGSVAAIAAFAAASLAHADDFDAELNMGLKPDPAKGLDIILHTPMSAPIMKVKDIDELWQVWEPEEKAKAEKATAEERHRMTFERYGWAERDDGSGLPLDYTPDGKGGLVTNCFACHGGRVAGKTLMGGGNSHIDLTALATDVRKLPLFRMGRDVSNIEDMKGPFNTPLNFHKGFTNAVIFAPMVVGMVDKEYGKILSANPQKLLHHDVNAPAWWHYKKKDRIYYDAFAPKTPRQLMPFAISPYMSEDQFHALEPNFVHIQAYINSLQPPKYPYEVDNKLASTGKELFEMSCARCHGTYGPDGKYPNKVIPIDKIGTDRRRFDAIFKAQREKGNSGWIQYFGKHPLDLESVGYIAPPLDGIWATAPYFHNGAAPTIHDVLNQKARPKVWKRDENGFDQKKVGLVVEAFDKVPDGLNSRQQRMYYNTEHVGNSNAGHPFPDEDLNADEKVAVTEYLKTL